MRATVVQSRAGVAQLVERQPSTLNVAGFEVEPRLSAGLHVGDLASLGLESFLVPHRHPFMMKRLEVPYAGVAQLVERQPSTLNVAGSNPVARST